VKFLDGVDKENVKVLFNASKAKFDFADAKLVPKIKHQGSNSLENFCFNPEGIFAGCFY